MIREGERDASIQRRVGAGLWGVALPAASLDTIVDAEMYAVLIYLRKMTGAGTASANARRCLILEDCKPALQAIEARGGMATGAHGCLCISALAFPALLHFSTFGYLQRLEA